MFGYGNHDEMKKILHEWTGTGIRDIKAERQIKGDRIWTLIDGKDGKMYIGCVRSEWDNIRESAKMPNNQYKIEGYTCDFAYGPGDYLIFKVVRPV